MLGLTCELEDGSDLQWLLYIFTCHYSHTDCNICLDPFNTHRCSLNHQSTSHRLSEKTTSLSILVLVRNVLFCPLWTQNWVSEQGLFKASSSSGVLFCFELPNASYFRNRNWISGGSQSFTTAAIFPTSSHHWVFPLPSDETVNVIQSHIL